MVQKYFQKHWFQFYISIYILFIKNVTHYPWQDRMIRFNFYDQYENFKEGKKTSHFLLGWIYPVITLLTPCGHDLNNQPKLIARSQLTFKCHYIRIIPALTSAYVKYSENFQTSAWKVIIWKWNNFFFYVLIRTKADRSQFSLSL